MSEQNIPTVSTDKPNRTSNNILRVILIAIPVAAAIPTVVQAIVAWQARVPYSEVTRALEQNRLWEENLGCPIEFKQVQVSSGATLNMGACERTGDIQINLSDPASEKVLIEWIAYNRLAHDRSVDSIWDVIWTAAKAADGTARPATRIAQASSIKLKCTFRPESRKIVRVVTEGGKCYRESFSPYQGKVEGREEVDCQSACEGAAPAPDQG